MPEIEKIRVILYRRAGLPIRGNLLFFLHSYCFLLQSKYSNRRKPNIVCVQQFPLALDGGQDGGTRLYVTQLRQGAEKMMMTVKETPKETRVSVYNERSAKAQAALKESSRANAHRNQSAEPKAKCAI